MPFCVLYTRSLRISREREMNPDADHVHADSQYSGLTTAENHPTPLNPARNQPTGFNAETQNPSLGFSSLNLLHCSLKCRRSVTNVGNSRRRIRSLLYNIRNCRLLLNLTNSQF